jgi:hypothetical protein
MDPIRAIYANQEDIPEQFAELYEERGGSWHLTKIVGLKTEADVSRVQRALEAERRNHQQLKQTLETFRGDRTLEEIQADLDSIPELKAAAEGNLDEDKINDLVEKRIRTRLGPVERERDQLKTKLGEHEAAIAGFQEKEIRRTIHDTVRSAAVKGKVLDTAQEDVLMLAERMFEVSEDGGVTTRDEVGVTPGITAEQWLAEMQSKRPHWWPPSQGGGARGGRGAGGLSGNPWTPDNWSLTEQGRYVQEHGIEKARDAAKAAGVQFGATAPAKKSA